MLQKLVVLWHAKQAKQKRSRGVFTETSLPAKPAP